MRIIQGQRRTSTLLSHYFTITVLRQHPVRPAPAPTPSEGPVTGFSPFGEPVPQVRPETYDAADESTGEHAAPATLGNDHVER